MSAAMAGSAAWTDLGGLQAIGTLARGDRAAGLQAAARQFESFFVSQMLQGMRAANEVLAADNPMHSNEMQFRQELLDRQLSVSLTQGRGIGLADLLARQLQRQYGAPAPTSALPPLSDEAQLQARRIDKAASQARTTTLPAMVGNALRVLEPIARRVRARVAEGLFAGKESFVRALLPEARRAAQALGVDHRVLIAQSALETGWGKREIIGRDRELDRCYGRVFDGLIETMIKSPSAANGAARLLFVAKNIERIGDYVKDICELNVYLTEAVFIKHGSAR